MSAAISCERTQTTVVGYAGAVETDDIEARFAYTPSQRFTAYAAPSIARSTREDLQGTVHRLGLGVQYALTPIAIIDVGYTIDRQNGAIDPLRSDGEFSRSTLSIGFATRWSSGGGQATAR